MDIHERVEYLMNNTPANNELVLVITPDPKSPGYFYLENRYRPIVDGPMATSKQIKYIKDMMKQDTMDLHIENYEDITKKEACSLIKYLLKESGYEEEHINKYKQNQYSIKDWEK
ncbi:MAG: hypothetical protein MSA56_08015 [Clostridium sp.]|nr:hypothetical protein [Clostridium sp.]